ncbi:hypothetical protein HKX48_008323, partial [Thoreauomyces humboldtii]
MSTNDTPPSLVASTSFHFSTPAAASTFYPSNAPLSSDLLSAWASSLVASALIVCILKAVCDRCFTLASTHMPSPAIFPEPAETAAPPAKTTAPDTPDISEIGEAALE